MQESEKILGQCTICQGSGRLMCRQCGGTGNRINPITQRLEPCSNCGHSGTVICAHCNGTGRYPIET